MRWHTAMLCFTVTLLLALPLRAAVWTTVVEELAERASNMEAAKAGQQFVFHDTQEATDLIAQRFSNTIDEPAMLRRFEGLQGVDTSLIHEFNALPPAERRIALELGEGAQRVLKLHPGEEGTRILNDLDVGGVAQMRTYGDFVVEGMAWLESDDVRFAIHGNLPRDAATEIMQTLGLKTVPTELGDQDVASLWKSVVRKTGGGAGQFWTHYIAPHKGKWLAGGLLVTYLAMPERFHDALGNLTEYGATELGKLGISVATSAGRGFASGITESVSRQYAAGPVSTVVTLGLIGALLLVSIPGVRWLVWRKGLRRFFLYGGEAKEAGDRAADSNPGLAKPHQPLRE